ncbi:PREDICTED: PRAME family member 12-like, partial [Dipodomys ordii]|uniref:PRAME family member 12-like n=1 Tax=Dipodomys ordii TaxID=10020 RepID=A0A1S3GF46_DIPOR
ILDKLQLACVEEVEVNCNWTLSSLATFAPYLSRMGNLRSLLLSHVHRAASIAPEEQERLVLQFTSQFAHLGCLQELSMDSVCFLEGRLHQVLRFLRTPLESLSITDSRLSESDLTCLSQSPSIRQLSELNLSGVRMTRFSPEPLRVLLESVAATVKTLDLEDCGIRDAQLTAILPALSRCSSLTTFNYLRNPVSVTALEALLVHTVHLSHLSLEMYSTPLEVYGPQGGQQQWRLNQLRDKLMVMVESLRQSRTVWFTAATQDFIMCSRSGGQDAGWILLHDPPVVLSLLQVLYDIVQNRPSAAWTSYMGAAGSEGKIHSSSHRWGLRARGLAANLLCFRAKYTKASDPCVLTWHQIQW